MMPTHRNPQMKFACTSFGTHSVFDVLDVFYVFDVRLYVLWNTFCIFINIYFLFHSHFICFYFLLIRMFARLVDFAGFPYRFMQKGLGKNSYKNDDMVDYNEFFRQLRFKVLIVRTGHYVPTALPAPNVLY